MRFIDISGKKFNRVSVISRYKKISPSKWNCICDCGEKFIADGYSIRVGSVKSCGCYAKEVNRNRMTTHGKSNTPESKIWHKIKERCSNKNCKSYPDYGGRGIKVCSRWMDFSNFLSDMGIRPSPKYSVERNDVNGDYEPSNCRWATSSEQANNKRNTIHITAFGETKPLRMWASDRRCIVSAITLWKRISMYKWDAEKAITQNSRIKCKLQIN